MAAFLVESLLKWDLLACYHHAIVLVVSLADHCGFVYRMWVREVGRRKHLFNIICDKEM